MAQAAQKTPIDGELHEDVKMQDLDSRIQEKRSEDAMDSSPPSPRLPPDRLATDHSTNLSLKPVATATADLTKSPFNSSQAQLAPGATNTALSRAHWDASDLWGTQSHGEPKKACAMCAQHLE